jgi:hypothetical protein
MPLTTMSVLPDLEGRKYGTLSLGYDRIGTIRDEFSALLALASAACGVPPEQLTILLIQQTTAKLNAAAATVDGSTM